MKCTNCGNEYEGNFCPACGTPAETSTPASRVCAKCGNRYEGNFCPACGTPADGSAPAYSRGPASMPPRPKKGIGCLIAVLVVVGFFIIIGIVGAIGGSIIMDAASDAGTSAVSPSSTEEPAATPVQTPAADSETSTPAPTEEDAAISDPDSSDLGLNMTMEEVVPLLDSIIAQNFDADKYSLEYDDTSITLSLWEDGVALGATLAASGNEEAKAAWDDMTDNIIYMSDSMTEALETLGLQDAVITVNILNEQNKDNVLLCVVDGVVFYDSTQE